MKNSIVIGIDVGVIRKGFHAVALQERNVLGIYHSDDPKEIADWCKKFTPTAIAIDAPCRWSIKGRSREAERELYKRGIRSFYTPNRDHAKGSDFYAWVFNGERLYESLEYPIFDGKKTNQLCCIETFPHAVQFKIWANSKQNVPVGSKSLVRRRTLHEKELIDVSKLANIDYVDAALCAVAAGYFRDNNYEMIGNSEEGFIIIPGNRN